MKRGGRWTYTVVCVMMAIGRFEMIDYRIGDRVRYHKRHDYNGDATINGVVGTVSSTTCSPGHIEVTWDEGKYAPKFPFVENVEPFPYPIPTPTPDERAVAPELVERMRKLVERISRDLVEPYDLREVEEEARAILAALEPVVDEDLVIARGIMADLHPDMDCRDLFVKQCMEGKHDTHDGVRAALAALRHSRTASRDVTPCTREQFEEDCRA